MLPLTINFQTLAQTQIMAMGTLVDGDTYTKAPSHNLPLKRQV